jgi:hypothetical protein
MALMNYLKLLFPNAVNIPWIWHFNKNILAQCKNEFCKSINGSHDDSSLEKIIAFELRYFIRFSRIHVIKLEIIL